MNRREPIDCPVCGEPFVPQSSVHQFCSADCKLENTRLAELGKRALVNRPAMTFYEIGDALGFSHTTMKKDFHRGMAKLRAAAQREDFR